MPLVSLDVPEATMQQVETLSTSANLKPGEWIKIVIAEKIRQPHQLGWEEMALIESIKRLEAWEEQLIPQSMLRKHWREVVGAPLTKVFRHAIERLKSKELLAEPPFKEDGVILTQKGNAVVRRA